MNEIGRRIIPHTSSRHSESNVAKIGGFEPGHPDIDGLGLHVQAVLGDAAGVRAKKLIAPWRSVSTDDVNLGIRAPSRGDQVREQIEQMRIVMMHVAGAVVAKEMIQPRERLGKVIRAAPVNDIQAFLGMGVIKAKPPFSRNRLSTRLSINERGAAEGSKNQTRK